MISLILNKKEFLDLIKELDMKPIRTGLMYKGLSVFETYQVGDSEIAINNIDDVDILGNERSIDYTEFKRPNWRLTTPDVLKHVSKKRN